MTRQAGFHRFLTVAASLCCLYGTVLAGEKPSRQPQTSDTAGQRIEDHLQARRLAGEYRLLSARRVELESLGDFVDQGELLARDGRSVRKLLLLGSTGEELSIVDLHRMRKRAQAARFGKRSPRLEERLAERAAKSSARATDVPLRLTLWTSAPPVSDKPHRFDSTDAAQAWRQAMRSERILELKQRRAPVLAEVERLGGRVLRVLDSPPVIEAELPDAGLAALEALPAVTAIDLPVLEADAGPAYQATFFFDADDAEAMETYSWTGIQGNGINVGVYEWSNLCGLWRENAATPAGFSSWSGYALMNGVAAIHGCDQAGVQDGDLCSAACNNGPGFCRGGRCMKEHVTQVASKLGSVRGGEDRNATQMNLFYANNGSRADRMNWLAGQGVTIVNDSETSGNDATINWSIRNDFISLTKAVGNSQGATVDCLDNGICVGSYSIIDTANIDMWKIDPTNDQGRYGLSGSTSFIDNAANRWDAEKPDVMGDGEASLISQMVTPRAGEWSSAFGTSFAAPMVGGLVALLQEDFPTAQGWPELVRPMLQVSAISHNVTGVSLSRNDGIDEIDGAGVPTASTLKAIVDDGTYNTMTLVPSSFDAGGDHVPPGAQVTLQPGETVRAALGWMYCVENNTNLLSADFDLWLREPGGGSVVDWSASSTNSLEMLQFTNDSGQTRSYELVVHRFHQAPCDGVEREFAGLAWTKTNVDLGPSRMYPVSKTADTADLVCDADCSLREAVRAANLTPGRDLITLDAEAYILQIPGATENAAATGDLDLTDDVVIRGAGSQVAGISAAGLDRIFQVLNGADVHISGLTLTQGNVAHPGGALAVSSGNAELSDVLVFFNQGTQGGGLWNGGGGALILHDCNVLGNTASVDGGGIFVNGGALEIFDTEINNNSAPSGGGIYSTLGTWTHIRTSTVMNNDATTGKGGGIRNFGDLQLNDSTLSGNSAALEGGALWGGAGGTHALVFSTVTGNTAPSGSALWFQGSASFDGALVDGSCVSPGGITDHAVFSLESPGDTCGMSPSLNLVNVPDLRLGELSFYGGPTRTCPPMPASPAIDAPLPIPLDAPFFDQRGISRPRDGDAGGAGLHDSGSTELLYVQLMFPIKNEVVWAPQADVPEYRVYRGWLADLIDLDGDGRPDSGYGQCAADPDPGDTAFVDHAVPPSGSGWYYLVEPMTEVGGTGLGWTHEGSSRQPATSCP